MTLRPRQLRILMVLQELTVRILYRFGLKADLLHEMFSAFFWRIVTVPAYAHEFLAICFLIH
jgi:hypothetical protein